MRLVDFQNSRVTNSRSKTSVVVTNYDQQSCNICGKSVANLKKHIKSHTPGQHKCPYCSLILTRADNLKRHVRMKHRSDANNFKDFIHI